MIIVRHFDRIEIPIPFGDTEIILICLKMVLCKLYMTRGWHTYIVMVARLFNPYNSCFYCPNPVLMKA